MTAAAGIGSADIPFDIIITPLITGSPDYIEWVKVQTMKVEDTLAHYNIRPEDEIHGLNNTIGGIGAVADASHATSTLVPPAGTRIQLNTDEKFAEGDDDEDTTNEKEAVE